MGSIVDELIHFPEKFIFPYTKPHHTEESHHENENKSLSSIAVDILDSGKGYTFFFDVPGLSKADIQVSVEDENVLVVRSSGKRKREDGEEERCKYVRLERKGSRKFLRKFRLPDDSNVSAISAKCENGVLSVSVDKLPPPPKPKTVEVTIS